MSNSVGWSGIEAHATLRDNLDLGKLSGAECQSTVIGMSMEDVYAAEGETLRVESLGDATEVKTLVELRALASHIAKEGHKRHRLSALPGLGKSTYFPLILAKLSQETVVVFEHSPALAAMVRESAERTKRDPLKSAVKDVPTVFVTSDLRSAIGDGKQVQVIYAPLVLVMDVAQNNCMPAVTVIHDESHVNNYLSFTWRAVCANISWVKKHIQMSATLDESIITDVKNARNPGGVVRVVNEVSVPRVAEWRLDDVCGEAMAPWSAECLKKQSTLVFSDDLKANEAFKEELLNAGIPAYCLNGRDRVDVVSDVEYLLANVTEGGFVIFADSTFRSGYTFMADAVIDTGRVRESYVDANGTLLERYRVAYATEVAQALARVGRVKRGIAYVNTLAYKSGASTLAIGETRHACALTRLMGYAPDAAMRELHPAAGKWSRSYCVKVLESDGVADSDLYCEDEVQPPDKPGFGGEARAAAPGLGFPLPDEIAPNIGSLLQMSGESAFVPRGSAESIFGEYSPTTRFQVPGVYLSAGKPWWMGEVDYRQVLTQALGGQDAVLRVEGWSDAELQWFASTLVADWNSTCDGILTSAARVSAGVASQVDRGPLLVAYAEGMRKAQADIAVHVRKLAVLRDALWSLYKVRPFDVTKGSVESDPGPSEVYRSAYAALGAVAHPTFEPARFVPSSLGEFGARRVGETAVASGFLLSTRSFADRVGCSTYQWGVVHDPAQPTERGVSGSFYPMLE